MNSSTSTALECLEGRELAAVVFVRSYIQLLFDGPYLNAYVWPKVGTTDRLTDRQTGGYRDALCAQIGKPVVAAVVEPKVRLTLQFADGVIIEISLKEEDRTSPEAAMLQADDGKKWNVW